MFSGLENAGIDFLVAFPQGPSVEVVLDSTPLTRQYHNLFTTIVVFLRPPVLVVTEQEGS